MEENNEKQPRGQKRKADALTDAQRQALRRERLKTAPPEVQAEHKEKRKIWTKKYKANAAEKGKRIVVKKVQVTVNKEDKRLESIKSIHAKGAGIVAKITTKAFNAVNDEVRRSEAHEGERLDTIADIHGEGVSTTGLVTDIAVDAVNARERPSLDNSTPEAKTIVDCPSLVDESDGDQSNIDLASSEVEKDAEKNHDDATAVTNNNAPSENMARTDGFCIVTSDKYQATSRAMAFLEQMFIEKAEASGDPNVVHSVVKPDGVWKKFLAVRSLYPPGKAFDIESRLRKLLFPNNQLHHKFDVDDIVDSRPRQNQPYGGGVQNVDEWVEVWEECVKLVGSDMGLILCDEKEELRVVREAHNAALNNIMALTKEKDKYKDAYFRERERTADLETQIKQHHERDDCDVYSRRDHKRFRPTGYRHLHGGHYGSNGNCDSRRPYAREVFSPYPRDECAYDSHYGDRSHFEYDSYYRRSEDNRCGDYRGMTQDNNDTPSYYGGVDGHNEPQNTTAESPHPYGHPRYYR